MHCGLFGKLLQKRDFVSLAVPREFLRLWEPWIERCLSESQLDLGREAWVAMFAAAPIWRFFLGAGLCGSTVRGAFMPSMDGLGRYFPLTLLAWPANGERLAGPDVDPQNVWFDAVEDLLLSTLKSDVSMEVIAAELVKLAGTSDMDKMDATERLFLHPGAATQGGQPLRQIFGPEAASDVEGDVPDKAQMTFWWTLGGEEKEAWAWSRKAMPNPQQFTAMLAGQPSGLPEDLFQARS